MYIWTVDVGENSIVLQSYPVEQCCVTFHVQPTRQRIHVPLPQNKLEAGQCPVAERSIDTLWTRTLRAELTFDAVMVASADE